jgi:hypothetical protein
MGARSALVEQLLIYLRAASPASWEPRKLMALCKMADERIPSTNTFMNLMAARADTEGYHAIDCLLTGFNALLDEWKRDLILFEDAEEQSNSLYRIRTAIEMSVSVLEKCQAGSEDEDMDYCETFAFNDEDITEVIYAGTGNHDDTSKARVPSDVVAVNCKPKLEKPVNMFYMDATVLWSLLQETLKSPFHDRPERREENVGRGWLKDKRLCLFRGAHFLDSHCHLAVSQTRRIRPGLRHRAH